MSISTHKVGKGYKNTKVSGGKAYHNQEVKAFKFLNTDKEYQKLKSIQRNIAKKFKDLKEKNATQSELDAVLVEYKKASKSASNYFAECKYAMINSPEDPIYKLLMAHKHGGAYDKMDAIVKVNTPFFRSGSLSDSLSKKQNGSNSSNGSR